MRTILISFLLINLASTAYGASLQLLNPKVLESSVNDKIQILNNYKEGDISPLNVIFDIQSGVIKQATVIYYKNDISLADAELSINNSTEEFSTPKFTDFVSVKTWRFEKEKFVVSLIQNNESDKDIIQVLYVQFMPMEKLFETVATVLNKDIEKEKRVEEKEYSFDGIWKNKKENDFGLIIEKTDDNKYSVSFFGAAGRFKPGELTPNTDILNDKRYKVISSDKIYFRGTNGAYMEYHKVKNIDAIEANKIKNNYLRMQGQPPD